MKLDIFQKLMVAIGTLAVLVLFTCALLWWQNSSYDEEQQILDELQRDVWIYDELKSKSSFKDNDMFIKQLLAHPSITRQEKRSHSYTMEFNQLNSRDVDTLATKILSSGLLINKFTIRKDAQSQGEILVEFGE